MKVTKEQNQIIQITCKPEEKEEVIKKLIEKKYHIYGINKNKDDVKITGMFGIKIVIDAEIELDEVSLTCEEDYGR